MNDAYNNSDNLVADGHANWEAQHEAQLSRELIFQLDFDFDRFPMPISFDPLEELKQLNLRKMRIAQLAERFVRMSAYRFSISARGYNKNYFSTPATKIIK